MKLVEIEMTEPADHLACEEVLLNLCEAGAGEDWLWFWEPRGPFVVLGYSRPYARDVRAEVCDLRSIPILRRVSGGGTVVQAPGCLNYALVLGLRPGVPWNTISRANAYLMEVQRNACAHFLAADVRIEGITDLALNGLKFSGNAQRRLQHSLLFHGSFLLNLDLTLVEELLPVPEPQPPYRQRRAHRDFLVNLKRPSAELRACLTQAWRAEPEPMEIPWPLVRQLAKEKYNSPSWTRRF
jgi:lipoate-protein ligase A